MVAVVVVVAKSCDGFGCFFGVFFIVVVLLFVALVWLCKIKVY